MTDGNERTCEVLRQVLKEFEFCCTVLNPNKDKTLAMVKEHLKELEHAK